MNHHTLTVRLQPFDNEALPKCYMGGTGENIPIIEWRDHRTSVYVQLGNHPDPARYLHDLAVKLLVLADEVDAARPVPYVVAGGES